MTVNEMAHSMARMGVRFRREVEEKLPERLGNKLVSAFKKNFIEESFFGQAWKDVKRRTNPTKKQAKSTDSRRRILTGRTGNLRRSVQMERTPDGVIIFSDLAYSAAHNDGTTTAGRKHNTTIPQRQFIGDHPETHRIIKEELDKIKLQP